MNRDFLEGLGLDAETAGAVMAEVEKCLAEKDAEIEKLRTDGEIDRQLGRLGARNFKAVKALMDMEALKDGDTQKILEQLEKLKEENGFLFDDKKTPRVAAQSGSGRSGGFGFKFTGVR